jgi:hypothetical protein
MPPTNWLLSKQHKTLGQKIYNDVWIDFRCAVDVDGRSFQVLRADAPTVSYHVAYLIAVG